MFPFTDTFVAVWQVYFVIIKSLCMSLCPPSWQRTWEMPASTRSWRQTFQRRTSPNLTRAVTCERQTVKWGWYLLRSTLTRLCVVFQADEEGLHHGQVHREALCAAALSWRCIQSAASVRGCQEQRHLVPDPGLLWRGGPDGGQPSAQRACMTERRFATFNSYASVKDSQLSN